MVGLLTVLVCCAIDKLSAFSSWLVESEEHTCGSVQCVYGYAIASHSTSATEDLKQCILMDFIYEIAENDKGES